MNYSTVTIPSNFPKERRPIYIRPVANITHRTKDEETPHLVREVQRIIGEAEGKTLIHTVSYDLADIIYRGLAGFKGCDLFGYGRSADRQRALDGYVQSRNKKAILIASSMERGVDLPDEHCELIIVCKVPYPSLSDKQVSARLYGTGRTGRNWYTVSTIRSIVQMTGRGMRHENDYCESYILDKQFTELYRKNRNLFPSWWREAIVQH